MRERAGILLRSSHFKSTAIFYVLSMATSFANFLYYPFIARATSIKAFGEVQFLMTIIFQLSILLMALNAITIILSARYAHNQRELDAKIHTLATFFNRATFILTLAAVCALSLSKNILQFDSVLPFIALGIAITSLVPFTIFIGALQGKGDFVASGIVSLVGSVLKLALSLFLLLIGWGATGALLGVGIAQILTLVFALRHYKISPGTLLSLKNRSQKSRDDFRLIAYAGSGIVIANLLTTADTIGGKLILNPREAGLYAGIATLAKIAIFLISPLTWMAVSSSASSTQTRAKHTNVFLLTSVVLCGALLLAYTIAPGLFASLLLGSQFNSDMSLLLKATVAMSALGIATFLTAIAATEGSGVRAFRQATLMATVFTVMMVILRGSNVRDILHAQLFAGIAGILYYYSSKLSCERLSHAP